MTNAEAEAKTASTILRGAEIAGRVLAESQDPADASAILTLAAAIIAVQMGNNEVDFLTMCAASRYFANEEKGRVQLVRMAVN